MAIRNAWHTADRQGLPRCGLDELLQSFLRMGARCWLAGDPTVLEHPDFPLGGKNGSEEPDQSELPLD
ncbi:MAG TPA: hypothetical protein VKA48_09675 [Gammaproteobacteria bacterium]|nr:hypothetical protein [Gammaproteobacteria bacterium]